MSVLMRKAEAEAMFQSLSERSGSWIWGRGYGAPFYWDDDYLAELFLVYPDRENFPEEIYTAGHNLWTYTTFASGIIGLLCLITFVVSPSINALRGVRLLSRLTPGGQIPDLHIVCFPAIAMWTLVATSILENPFDFRLTGSFTGIVAAIPQHSCFGPGCSEGDRWESTFQFRRWLHSGWQVPGFFAPLSERLNWGAHGIIGRNLKVLPDSMTIRNREGPLSRS
ncbi:MAG: hypothetical protein R3F31_16000 [Verrucomicrobiales bacterium]